VKLGWDGLGDLYRQLTVVPVLPIKCRIRNGTLEGFPLDVGVWSYVTRL
jgi:hypothetical protein